MNNYRKSKKRLILLLALSTYLVYNIISPKVEESRYFSLILLPMALLALNDNLKE